MAPFWIRNKLRHWLGSQQSLTGPPASSTLARLPDLSQTAMTRFVWLRDYTIDRALCHSGHFEISRFVRDLRIDEFLIEQTNLLPQLLDKLSGYGIGGFAEFCDFDGALVDFCLRLKSLHAKTGEHSSVQSHISDRVIACFGARFEQARRAICAAVFKVEILLARVHETITFSQLVFAWPNVPFRAVAPAAGVIEILVSRLQVREIFLRSEVVDGKAMGAAREFISFV